MVPRPLTHKQGEAVLSETGRGGLFAEDGPHQLYVRSDWSVDALCWFRSGSYSPCHLQLRVLYALFWSADLFDRMGQQRVPNHLQTQEITPQIALAHQADVALLLLTVFF